MLSTIMPYWFNSRPLTALLEVSVDGTREEKTLPMFQ
jgi:hypothetical protein